VAQYIIEDSIDSKYKENNYTFPNYKVNPKNKKEKEYCIDVARTIYAKHIQGRTGIPLTLASEYDTNRMYGSSTQPASIYMDRFLEDQSKNSNTSQYDSNSLTNKNIAREGWMNVDWTPLNLMAKIKNALHGLYDNAEYDISARATDQKAGAEREEMKLIYLLYKHFGAQLEQMNMIAGLPYFEPDFIPETEVELSIYENAGGFKLINEIAIEEIISHTFDISDWRDIKEKLIDDAVEVGRIAILETFDDATQKIMANYLTPDPRLLIIQKSDHWDYKDAEYGAYLSWEKISYLRTKGISENILCEVAEKYCGINGNPMRTNWSYYNLYENNTWKYDDFRVPVLKTYWIDFDESKKLIYTTLEGRTRVKQIDYDEKVKEKDKTKLDYTAKRKLYQCSWIIDTDYAYDFGLAYNQTKNPKLPIQVRELRTAPLVSVLRPHIDQINLAWFKFQNALAQLRIMGYAIDIDALDNVELSSGEKLDQLTLIRMAGTIGILPFRRLRFDGSLQSMASSPVTELPSGMGKVLDDIMQVFQWEYAHIELLTGLNQTFLGGLPAPRTGKAVVEAAVNNSSNVTRPIIDCIMQLKSSLAESIANGSNVLLKTNKTAQESYAKVIGESKVEVMKIASQHAEYGIKLEPRPTDADWAKLNEYINYALASGRDGRPTLDIGVAFQIEQLKQNGMNLKQITLYIMNALRKIKKQDLQKQILLTQQQQDNNMALMQAKSKAGQQEIQGDIYKQDKNWDRKDQHEGLKGQVKANQEVLKKRLEGTPQIA
jgi:hypothetical protein